MESRKIQKRLIRPRCSCHTALSHAVVPSTTTTPLKIRPRAPLPSAFLLPHSSNLASKPTNRQGDQSAERTLARALFPPAALAHQLCQTACKHRTSSWQPLTQQHQLLPYWCSLLWGCVWPSCMSGPAQRNKTQPAVNTGNENPEML
jgi:hypothetical protein